MKNALFKKYFSSFALMMLVCIFVLGVALMFFAAEYFRSDREDSLTRAASKAAAITAQNYAQYGYISRADVERDYAVLADSAGGTIMYCGLDGIVDICSEHSDCAHAGKQVPAKGINEILEDGSFYSIAYNSALSPDSPYTLMVGVPVVIDDAVGGYIFIMSPMKSLITFMTDVFFVITVASILMLLVVASIIYSMLKRMLKPLSDISEAAAAFGKGDFTSRVRVRGDDEISSLGRVFNKMADDLQELEISRRSFMGNIAHELRTPMTTIGGYIDGILDGTIPPDQQEKYLHVVSDEVKRLARLASSTLAVARMEEASSNAALASVNVCQILTTVVLSAERRINGKNIEIDGLDVPDTYAKCDADMLHQVLYNLVDNAVKFTPERGKITFNVRTLGGRTLISVNNTGSGISKTDMPLLFDRFYKTDKSRGMDKTGSGLGLFIVKTLVNKMNGDITVSSVEGEYSEFTVDLEAALPPKPPKTEDVKPQAKNNLFERIGKHGKGRDKTE